MSARPGSARPAVGLAVLALLASAAPAAAPTAPAVASTTSVPSTTAVLSTAGTARSGSATTRPVFVTNRNSSTISVFAADRAGGLAPVGTPITTAAAPRGIVVSPDGRAAYVANSQAPAVSAYTIGAGGALTLLGTPLPSDTGLNTFSLAIAPDGRTLYVVTHDEVNVGDAEGEGAVMVLRIGPDGGLTRLGASVRSGAVHPRSAAVTPDGRFLFISHGDPDFGQPGLVTRFAIGAGGTLTPLGAPIPAGTADGAMSLTPDGRFLFVPAEGSHQVFAFAIGADGDLRPVPGTPLPQPGTPNSSLVTPDGRHLYVTSLDADSVSGYTIGAGGTLAPAGTFGVGDLPDALATSPDGRHLYVANFGANNLTIFDTARDGSLREAAGSPVPTGGQGPAFRSIAFLPNRGPVAAFSASARPVGQPTAFDASASADPDGRVARYDWDFGDGTVLRDGGPAPRHAYARAGSFPVTLTVTDDEGCATRLVYTGFAVVCTGSPAAIARRTVTVSR